MYDKDLLGEEEELFALLLAEEGFALPQASMLQARTRTENVPLSFGQERLWFLDQWEPHSSAYNMFSALRLQGMLHIRAFEKSLHALVQRHETLRTTFVATNGQPAQVIASQMSTSLPVVNLDGLSPDEQQAELQRLAQQEALRPFDLSLGPLLRTTLLRLHEGEQVFLLTLHHIISDGWSLGVFNRELLVLYNAFTQDQPYPLLALPIQYADYALWQRQHLQGEVLQEQLHYWKTQLHGAPALLELPTDRPRPPTQTFAGAIHQVSLPAEMMSSLHAFAQREGVTLFTMLLACLQTLLMRYSQQEDFCIGTYIAGRTQIETEALIGYFINNLALRADLSGDPSFREALQRANRVTQGAYAHQDIPFEQVLQELHLERTLRHTPLFQVMLIYQNVPWHSFNLPGLTISPVTVKNERANFDLSLWVVEISQELYLTFEYNTDLFEEASIRRLASHFQTLLQAVMVNPHQPVSQVALLSASEQRQVLSGENMLETNDVTGETSFAALFAAQAVRTPETVAIVCDDQHLTYGDLLWRAERLAAALQHQGIGPEVAVGLCLERSLEAIIGLLGILQAGGIYVPLDPAWPDDRLAFILDETQMPLLLTQERLLQRFLHLPVTRICLDADWPTISAAGALPLLYSTWAAQLATATAGLAYVIYTSGSTGQPKGVGIEQRSLLHFCEAAGRLFGIEPGDRVLQFASLSFDTSLEEIAPCLSRGGTLYLSSESMLGDPLRLLQTCALWGLSVLDLPTAYWHELARSLSQQEATLPASLRLLIIGGEKAQAEPLRNWQQFARKEVRLLNTYGPTETTVVATAHWPERAAERARPAEEAMIGGALPHVQVYVLDRHMQPVPTGVPGELYLGGAGVARGYLQRPHLTAERFVPHPWSNIPGARLYRTGDLVRFMPDGALEFRGRVDNQVKIRGYRIELGEIETVLAQHPAVGEALVLAREDTPGEKRLVAYVVPNQEQSELADLTVKLRVYLSTRLPAYLLPGAFVLLHALPLTSRGKVDRHALPAPKQREGLLAEGWEVPRTPTEEMLAELWAQVLHVEQVSRHDHFFHIGGHSLLATQLVARLRQVFGVEVSLRTIFQTPTLLELARQIEVERQSQYRVSTPPLLPSMHQGEAPLSYAQQRLWFLDQLLPNSAAYAIPLALQLSGRLEVAALELCVQELVRRHESLRTTIVTRDGRPLQIIAPAAQVSLPLLDLSALHAQAREQERDRLAQLEAQQPFSLQCGPLVRTTLIRLEQERHVLLLTLHHIITDAWSMGVLLRELATLYHATIQGQLSPLSTLPIQYADYALWQRQWLEGREAGRVEEQEVSPLEQQLAFWYAQLAGAPARLELPTDHPRPQVQTFRGAHLAFAIDPALLAGLRQLSRQEGTTLFMTLLAAFAALLSRYSGQEDLVLGTPIANRTRAEVEEVIGFFANTLALRSDLSGNPSVREMLRRMREAALDAYAHQDLPFERLVDALQPERDLSHTPLFQVVFALQTATGARLQLSGVEVELLSVESGLARFDLTLTMYESQEAMLGVLEYNLDLFEPTTMQRMAGYFQTLLEGMVAHPDRRLADIPLLTEAERRQVLLEWNATHTSISRDRSLSALFEAQVACTPRAVALALEEEQVTYEEVNRRANQLAHYLRELGVTTESLVGICLERSPALVVGLLGILKAGGAYVPLDPNYPAERLTFMLQHAQAAALITTSTLNQKIFQQHQPEGGPNWAIDTTVICLDREREQHLIAQQPAINCTNTCEPENLAYVIYTSGSTGRPKGVQVTHRGLCNLISWHQRTFALTAQDRATQLASLSFDAAGWEIWPYLTAGAAVIFVAEDIRNTPQRLRTWLMEQQITISFLPTPLAESVVDGDWPIDLKLRTLLTGGDRLHRLARTDFPFVFVNNYGPTENAVVATSGVVEPHRSSEEAPPIGRPIANTRCYVLDSRFQPVPVGAIGELFIAGTSLARGYLAQPELTAERFIPNPFSTESGERLYRTGDMVRYLPDGQLEFRGRNDFQVKIRGYRIELGEVEITLRQHPLLREALVEMWEPRPGDRRLVAYVVPASHQMPSSSDLRSFLSARLPAYMLPAAIVQLEALPLTPNGKLDRRALPLPESTRSAPESLSTVPLTASERVLASIWADVLGLEDVGIHDNYFELGGDSILSMLIVAKANAAGLPLTPKLLFQYQTIAQLAAMVDAATPAVRAAQEPVQGAMPLTPIQHWFFQQKLPEPQHWNQAILMQVCQPLSPAVVQQAIHALLLHHDALRLRAQFEPDGWHLRHAAPETLDQVPFVHIDLSALAPPAHISALQAISAELQASLNLTQGPLLRSALFTLGPQQPARLLLIIHHLVVDIVSWQILLDDLQHACQQLRQHLPLQLPPKTTSFQHWAQRLEAYAQSDALRPHLDFWLSQPWEKVRSVPLDTTASLGSNTEDSAQTVVVTLTQQETQALLQEVPKAYHTQINEVLLTALVEAFARWTGSTSLLLHLEGHGREDLFEGLDLSHTVGWFTALAPLVLSLADNQAPGESLKHIKEHLRNMPQSGISFGLMRYLSQEPTIREQLAGLPRPEVSFNYGGRSALKEEEGLFAAAAESPGATHSKLGQRSHVLDIYGRIMEGQLYLGWTYSENLHRRTTIEALAHDYLEALRSLIAHCQSPEAGGYTPADFPEAALSQDALDALIAKLAKAIKDD